MCPECGGKTKVTDSRKNFKINNVTYRRRKCLKCGFVFSTYEIGDDTYNKLFKAYRIYERIERMMEK